MTRTRVKPTRQARIGDVGIVTGMMQQHPMSGLATLVIESVTARLLIHGDWRAIMRIVDAFKGQEVEVAESEGSSYGCHSVRPVEQPWEEEQE